MVSRNDSIPPYLRRALENLRDELRAGIAVEPVAFRLIVDLIDEIPARLEDDEPDMAAIHAFDKSPATPLDLVLAEEILGEAESLARAGLPADAAHRIDLIINPKWPSQGACYAAYEAHMDRQRAGLPPLSFIKDEP